MRRWLLITAGVFLVILTAGTVLLRQGLSLALITPIIEQRASALLGRPLVLGSAPSLQLSSGLTLRAGHVSIANAEWAASDPLLSLQRLMVRVDISSLLADGPVIIEELELDGLQINLETDSEGRSNLPTINSAEDTADGEDDSGPALPIAVKHSTINDVTIRRHVAGASTDLHLFIAALGQTVQGSQSLQLTAQGNLQERPWNLAVEGSNLASLLNGEDLSARFSGSLGELSLSGEYALPDFRRLSGLTLTAALNGPVPERVADLSPLLSANEIARVELDVKPRQSELGVHLLIDLLNIDVAVDGSVARPETGDGLDLAITLDATSLPRLASALRLGETDELPLNIAAQLGREGTQIRIQNLNIEAGPHRIQGDILLPAFPGTDGAVIEFTAQGPQLGFYERLFMKPFTLAQPYRLQAQVSSIGDGKESAAGSLAIGEHQLEFSGALDNYPSYRGSNLKFTLQSPSLQSFSETFNLTLPDLPLEIDGAVEVSDAALLTIRQLEARSDNVSARINGDLKSYPDFDEIDLKLEVVVASLNALGQRAGLEPIADEPANLMLSARGSPKNLRLYDPHLVSKGLELRGISGDVQIRDGKPDTDLRLRLELENLPYLLGSYAHESVPDGRFSVELVPRISADLLTMSFEQLRGTGIAGEGRIEMTPDFAVNAKTMVSAEFEFTEPARLIPELEGYTPPSQPLTLQVTTRPTSDTTAITARLSDASGGLLNADINIPNQPDPDISARLRGAGTDLRRLGKHSAMPDEALPYAVDLNAGFANDVLSLDATELAIAGTTLTGKASWDNAERSLRANLLVPNADLGRWLKPDEDNATAGSESPPSRGGNRRLIPDTKLPLELLDEARVDVTLATGPLGIVDPIFPGKSLVDSLRLRLRSGSGRGELTIEELRGSRGILTGVVTVARDSDSATFSNRLTVREFPLGLLNQGNDILKLPVYKLDAEFDGTGISPRQIAASLNGTLLLVGTAGTLSEIKFGFATESFVSQLFTTLLPMFKDNNSDMEVECSVLALRADRGILRLDPGMVFRTRKVDLSARGEIDLRTENLKIRFDNQARQGLGISAASLVNPYVEIAGTLARPKLGLDLASSAIAGGAAVASGGLTTLAKPLYGRFLNRSDPCETALTRWNDSQN